MRKFLIVAFILAVAVVQAKELKPVRNVQAMDEYDGLETYYNLKKTKIVTWSMFVTYPAWEDPVHEFKGTVVQAQIFNMNPDVRYGVLLVSSKPLKLAQMDDIVVRGKFIGYAYGRVVLVVLDYKVVKKNLGGNQ